MSKNETLMILAMLNAFYAGGKNDPEMQVNAWHLILKKYDFEDTKEAVLRFAENDTRQVATFPAVGLIVAEVRKLEETKRNAVGEVIVGVSYGRSYDMLTGKAKTLISEALYNEWLSMDAEVFSAKAGAFKHLLTQRQKQLGGANDRPNNMH